MSRYLVDSGRLSPSRLKNARFVASELFRSQNQIEAAFDHVQADIDAGTGGPGLLIFDFVADTMWVVNHNLGRPVSVEVLNSGGARIGADVSQVTPNQVRVYFEVPVPGRVLIR